MLINNNNNNTSSGNIKAATDKYYKNNIHDEHVVESSSTFLDNDGMQLDPTAINLNASIDNINDSTVVDSLGGSDDNADPTVTININKRKVNNTLSSLNSDILLSSKGLPYIVEHAHKRIKISSKKSNYDNLSNIIEFYQIWAHQCFPKFRFRDFINNCERIGRVDRDIKDYRLNLFLKEANIKIGMDLDENSTSIHAENEDGTRNVTDSNGEETNITNDNDIRNEENKSSDIGQNVTNVSGSSLSKAESSSNLVNTNVSITTKKNNNESPDYSQSEQNNSITNFTHSSSTVSQEGNNTDITADAASVSPITIMNNDITNNTRSDDTSIQNSDGHQSDGSNNEDELALMRELDI